MFYEMILFCSLAGVVGAIIGLAEINTEKARNFTGKKRGVPAAGVPHCHLVAPALGSQNRWGSAGSPCLRLALVPVSGHATWTWGTVSFQCFKTKLDNCKPPWSVKDGCRKARGKDKIPPEGSLRQTWLCWGKLVFTLRPADSHPSLLLHTKLPQPQHVLRLSYGRLRQHDGLAGTASATLSQGDRPESRADALFPIVLDQALVPVCPDAICSATPENLTPLCASAMTHFLCILKRIQMLTFQHWKKEKLKC